MAGNVSPEWNTHGACGWCGVGCWCAGCHSDVIDKIPDGQWMNSFTHSHMYLCPDCGNKRCPKGTNHELACTGSNEPGQPGSAY